MRDCTCRCDGLKEDLLDILLLRLIHIGSGAFWVGSVFTFVGFVQPTAVALGPEAQKFTYGLLHDRRLPLVILGSAIVTVIAGVTLLTLTTNGLKPDLLFGESRLGFTVGGTAAIVTLGIGGLYVYPRTQTVARIIGLLLAERRAPTADEQHALGVAGRQSRVAGWIVLAGLTLAIACMATARYWGVVI